MGAVREAISDADIQNALDEAGGNKTKAAERLGMARTTFRDRLAALGKFSKDPDTTGESLSIQEEGEATSVAWKTREKPTADQIAEAAGLDLTVWHMTRCDYKRYEVAMKVYPGDEIQSGGDGKSHKVRGPDKPTVVPLWYVSARFERIMPKLIYEGMKACCEDWVARYSPKYPKMKYRKLSDPHLLEISIADAHFGKYAWDKETGHDYDLSVATKLYQQAFEDLLNKTQSYKIEKITIPLGNDLFHIDNRAGTTERGTIVDYDSRYTKIITTVQQALVEAIDLALEVAPVEVLHVPGNHDRTVSWHLSNWLHAHYGGRTKSVTVDIEPRTRKYQLYGNTLLGWTHGDQEKHRDLPLIMASEAADLWAKSLHREIHLGHLHQRKQLVYLGTDTRHSVTVRVLPSISATDYWHYANGYVGSPRAAEAYLYSKEDCYTGHFSSNVRN